jgi:hypothetical protein
VTSDEKIPEPYALRGMKYLGKHAVRSDDGPKPATTALEVVAATSAATVTATNTKQTVISGKTNFVPLSFDRFGLRVKFPM